MFVDNYTIICFTFFFMLNPVHQFVDLQMGMVVCYFAHYYAILLSSKSFCLVTLFVVTPPIFQHAKCEKNKKQKQNKTNQKQELPSSGMSFERQLTMKHFHCYNNHAKIMV